MVERRLAGRALAAWDGVAPVPGFADNSLFVADPAGAMRVETVGAALAISGLMPGMVLDRRQGIAGEFHAACHLVALNPVPLPFEGAVTGPDGRCLLLRGVALPLAMGDDPAGRVQIVASWREVLSRSARQKLRRELVAALAGQVSPAGAADPFAHPGPRPGG